MTRYLSVLLLLFLGGCATAPSDAESQREVVLRYLDANVGTAGPFGRHAKKELDVLSDKDRAEAMALLNRGAVGFLVFETAGTATDGKPSAPTSAPRVILVQHGKVAGDFRGVK
jgi:hypothetical protein